MSASEVLVYFRFAGGTNDDDDKTKVATVDQAIPRAHLDAFPDALLSKLASDTWKQDETVGKTANRPIVTKPMDSPYCDEWCVEMVGMIKNAYEWLYQKNQNPKQPTKLSLPPVNVELGDALPVLNYYGLNINNPSTEIDLSAASTIVQIRAKLYLKYLEHIHEAVTFVTDFLMENPTKHQIHFLFTEKTKDMNYIDNPKNNNGSKFVRVGGDTECEKHLEWVENSQFQEKFVSLLQGIGLEASIPLGYSRFLATCVFDVSGFLLLSNREEQNIRTGFSLVGDNDESGNPYPYYEIAPESCYTKMFVVVVKIPEAPKKRRKVHRC